MSDPARGCGVTVVVVSRNRVSQLCDTLALHLSLPERPRVVVVDDASTDGTAGVIARRFPEVTVIALSEPRGAVARNAGLRAAGDPYVAFCDDDAWLSPGSLARAAALLDEHPRLGLISPQILVCNQQRLDPVCELMARSPLPPSPGQVGRPVLGFVACAVVVRRAAVLEVGGFCKRLHIGAEEKLLAWDLADAGWQLSYVPELIARHCPAHLGERRRRQAQTMRNDLWINWLRRPPAAALRASVREVAASPRDRATARALLEAIAGSGWVLRERRRACVEVEAMISLLESSPA